MHRRDEKCIQYFGFKNLKGKDHSEDLGVDGKIISEWIFGSVGRCGLDLSGSGQGPAAGSYEHDNELLGSINGKELLDQLSDYQLLIKISAPWS
jgi:hypothetical protein